MPSKREGFGLVALEAVAAGIPIVVSVESGVAALLYSSDIFTTLGDEAVSACVAEVDGDLDIVCNEWALKLHEILTKQREAFDRAALMRKKLLELLTWEKTARQLSANFQEVLKSSSQERR
jgi:glycosyltransferase involved in cell wall biosynthesis